jgi:D-alanyl-lipoteichoic acid acyltransferase DltB (MBOAT superfamily)
MLLGGLWHGSNWTFVVWGAFHGLMLTTEKLWNDLRGTKPKSLADLSRVEVWVRRVVVFHLVALSWVFFRAPSFQIAMDMLRSIVVPSQFKAEYMGAMILIPLFTLLYFALTPLRKRVLSLEPRGILALGYAGILLLLLVFGATNAEFIYFQF